MALAVTDDRGRTEANARLARWATAFEQWDQWRGINDGFNNVSVREKWLLEQFLTASRELADVAEKADIITDEDIEMAEEEARQEERWRVSKQLATAESGLAEARRILRTVQDTMRSIEDPGAAPAAEETSSEGDQFGGKLAKK